MIIDSLGVLSTNQAISASGATNSTNSIDVGVLGNYLGAAAGQRNVGPGQKVKFVFTITEAFTGSLTTCSFSIGDSADDTNFVAIASTPLIAKATLVIGYQFELDVPNTNRRYLNAIYTTDNTASTGKVTCQQVLDVQTNRSW